MKIRELASEIFVPYPRERVFRFFSDAANLDAITPPWLGFRIATPPPIVMREGALIEYRLKLRGIPLRWRTRITAWDPPLRFVDEQLSGPYRMWAHEHTFVEVEGGTLVRDHVRYAVLCDALVHRLLVRPDIERIFAFRAAALANRAF